MPVSTPPQWDSRCEGRPGRPVDLHRKPPRSRSPHRRALRTTTMPEGDTIFRAARTLQRALAGKPVTSFESAFPALNRVNDDAPIAGRTIERIHSAGKHLLVRFSGGLVLRTHMRMNGTWHIYRTGEKWQRSRRDMRIVITTADFEAVGFNIPVAEFMSEREV